VLPLRRREVIFRNRAHRAPRARRPTPALGASESVKEAADASGDAASGARGGAAAAAGGGGVEPSPGEAELRPGSVLLEVSIFDGRLKRYEFVVHGEQTLDEVPPRSARAALAPPAGRAPHASPSPPARSPRHRRAGA